MDLIPRLGGFHPLTWGVVTDIVRTVSEIHAFQECLAGHTIGQSPRAIGLQGGNDEIVHHLDFVPALEAGRRLGQRRLDLWHVEPVFILAQAGFDITNALKILVEFIIVGLGEASLHALSLRQYSIKHAALLIDGCLSLRQRQIIG